MNQVRVIHIKIFRFDPERDSSPHYDEYRIEIQGVMKILDLLELIYQKHDPSLAYRSSCRSGKCGVCSVTVNGRPVLACREDLPGGIVLIEPLANYPVVRDLIVDRRGYDQKMEGLSSSLSPVEDQKGTPPRDWNPTDFDSYDRLSKCIECLLCDATCPVLALSLSDYGGPALFRQDAFLEADKRLLRSDPSPSERLHLDDCSTCKACSASCPKGIEVFDEAVLGLRRRRSFQEQGLTEMQKNYLRTILDTGSLFTPYRVPLSKQLPEVNEPENMKGEILFFPGCMMNMQYQGAGKAIVRILTSLGIRVLLPKDLICCGGPLLWTGQDEAFSEVSRKNIRVFERLGISTLVTGCAGCGMTLKKGYEGRFEGQKAFIVYDFTEYLELLKPFYKGGKEREWRVTYHDPCHLRRGQGIWEEPRRLLNVLPDIHFVEIEDSDRCCGGMLATLHRDLASALSKKKAETIIDANVDVVMTECPFCRDMISKALKKEGKSIAVYMVAELIRELYAPHFNFRDRNP